MKTHHFYSVNTVSLSEDGNTSDVEVLRSGVIRDRGLKITPQMLADFVKNFKANVYGTELQVNLNHNRGDEAAGWIKGLYIDPVDETRLMASVEWTVMGMQKIKNKLYKFVSAEFASLYPHHETGSLVKNVFSGLALTNTPALKGQMPISLSEEINLSNQLNNAMFKTYITELNERKFVSAQDKAMAVKLFSELPAEEQEEMKPIADEVAAKPEVDEAAKEAEEKAAAEKAEAEKAATEAAAAKDKEEETLSEKMVSLEEISKAQAAEIAKLKEEKLHIELSSVFDNELLMSKENPVGLVAEQKDEVVGFMTGLSTEQRESFKKIVGAIKSVDLSTIGSTETGSVTALAEEAKMDAIVALTEKLMKEDTSLSIEAAQKKATAQLAK